MRNKFIFSIVIFLILILESLFPVYASDYSSLSQEEIKAEIEKLESELKILYSLLEAPDPSSESEDDSKTSATDILTYTGNGDGVVTIDEFDGWHMFVIDGNSSAKYFGVIAYDAEGERLGSLVNTTEVYHGIVYDDTQSAKMLEVKATGDWSINVVSLYAAHYGLKGDTVSGSGDDVILFYTDKGEASTAIISGNSGADYFGVIAYDGTGSRVGSLVNTTDVYSGTVLLKRNPRIFEIKASGDWSIKFE